MYRKYYRLLTLFWFIIITYLSLIDSRSIPTVKFFLHTDKIVHFIFHFILTTLCFLSLKNNKQKEEASIKKELIVSCSIAFVYGSVIEIIQAKFITTRSGDIFDIFANTMGSLVSVILLIYFYKRRNYKNFRRE